VRAGGGSEFVAASDNYALRAENTTSGGDGIRARATTTTSTRASVYAYNAGSGPAVWANTSTGTYSGYFLDSIYVEGSCIGCLLVQIALNDSGEVLEPGDLAAVSGLGEALAGSSQPILRVHRASEGETVVGVVQVRGVRVESTQEGQALESIDRAEGEVQPGDYLFLVVYGPAQVRADASAGAIAVGARLTAGQGGAARALQVRAIEGMVVAEGAPGVGIALEALESGSGLISVFVTLN
jgi:hypothetical protein